MKEKRDRGTVLLGVLLPVAFLYVWGVLLLFPQYAARQFLWPAAWLFLAGVVFFCLLVLAASLVKRTVKAIDRRGENRLLFAASVMLLGAELLISWNIAFQTGWDPGAVWYGAWYSATEDAAGLAQMSEYFSIYPNNLLLCFLYSVVLKLNLAVGAPVSNGILLLDALQCVVLMVSGALTYRCARRFVGVRGAWLAYGMYVILAGLSPWMAVPYSDGTGILFPVLLLWLYLRMRESGGRKQLLFLALLAAASYVGFKIKPTALIVSIAIGVVELLRAAGKIAVGGGKETAGRLLRGLGVSAAAGACAVLLVQLAVGSLSLTINPEAQLGIAHYFMIGSDPESGGGFSQEALDFSSGIASKKERTAANMQAFGEHLQTMGVSGYADLWNRKAVKTYLDGTFGWGGVGESFYVITYPERGALGRWLRLWYYDDRPDTLYAYHALALQLVWVTLLVAVPFSVCQRAACGTGRKVLALSVLGLMLYLQIFEAQSRYLFIYVPFYCMLAAIGIRNAAALLRQRRERGGKEK